MGRGLVGQRVGHDLPLDQARQQVDGVGLDADRQRPAGVAGRQRRVDGTVQIVPCAHRGSGCPAAGGCARGRPRPPGRRPRSWSPPAAGRRPCRQDRRSPSAARAGCRRSAAERTRRASRRCPGECPGCRCRSTSRRSSGRTWSAPGPRAGETRPPSPSAAPAASWRSAPAAPRRGCGNTATGLPDWTSRVSSSPSRRSVATMASNERPVAGRLARAAVDHQVVGPLGHLGVEVVHQHAQRRLLLPAAAAELEAPRGADRAGAGVGGSGHAPILVECLRLALPYGLAA